MPSTFVLIGDVNVAWGPKVHACPYARSPAIKQQNKMRPRKAPWADIGCGDEGAPQ